MHSVVAARPDKGVTRQGPDVPRILRRPFAGKGGDDTAPRAAAETRRSPPPAGSLDLS